MPEARGLMELRRAASFEPRRRPDDPSHPDAPPALAYAGRSSALSYEAMSRAIEGADAPAPVLSCTPWAGEPSRAEAEDEGGPP